MQKLTKDGTIYASAKAKGDFGVARMHVVALGNDEWRISVADKSGNVTIMRYWSASIAWAASERYGAIWPISTK